MILLYRERERESFSSNPAHNSSADNNGPHCDVKLLNLEEQLSQKNKLINLLSSEINNIKVHFV